VIIDAEKAFIIYFQDNTVTVTGYGNAIIPVYRKTFPDDAATVAIAVYVELREGHESVNELEPIGLRIMVRADAGESSFVLMQNVDSLLDRVVHKNLSDDVELCICRRNSGPTPFKGEHDNRYYNTTLYTATVRYRGND